MEQMKWWIVAVMNDRRISYRRRPDGERVSDDQPEMRYKNDLKIKIERREKATKVVLRHS